MMKQIDLNCDLGEVLSASKNNFDHKLMPYLSSCNIATGGHAGDDATMHYTIELANNNNVAIGAHPSYPDRVNFGRKSTELSLHALRDTLHSQISNFCSIANKLNTKVHHVKPHGALYNEMQMNNGKAELVISIIKDIDPEMQLYGMANSAIEGLAAQEGIQYIHEVFADRSYDALTQLRSRENEGALLTELVQVEKHIERIVKKGSICLYNGIEENIKAQTVCVHGDTANSVRILAFLSSYFEKNQIDVSPT